MSLGYIPSADRLRLPPRPLPGAFASRAETTAPDASAVVRAAGRGLILDLDDTLYPRERFVNSGFAAVARHAAEKHGVPAGDAFAVLARARAGAARGREFQVLCDRFGLSHDTVPALLHAYRRHVPSIWLGHDVSGVLHRLRAGGWRLAILTNGLPSVQFRKIAALGLMSLVDEVVYAEEHAPGGKPAVAPFKAALRALDLAPAHCLFVGDDLPTDVRGARAAGMRTIRLARPAAAGAGAEDADIVIDSLAQLPEAAAVLLDTVDAHVA